MKRKFKQLPLPLEDLKDTAILNWIKESNRDKHFKYALLTSIPVVLFFTFISFIMYKEDLILQNYVMISLATLFGYGCLGAGMEFKDKQYGNKFDYLDLIATVLGAIPMLILILIPVLIFYFNN